MIYSKLKQHPQYVGNIRTKQFPFHAQSGEQNKKQGRPHDRIQPALAEHSRSEVPDNRDNVKAKMEQKQTFNDYFHTMTKSFLNKKSLTKCSLKND